MRTLVADDPAVIGPYRILAELGRGGMGRVLLGGAPDGRLVALKLVGEEFVEDPGFRSRFRGEVKVSRQVAGAYTAAVIDADPDAPLPWLASVYVPGPSLGEAVRRTGVLPEASVLRLAAGLAAALIEIHRARLIHRDLKPSNVLLTDDGLRVIDFGIARIVETEGGGELTSTAWLAGTPGFMSPEQARGQELTPASDVFSLGSVLVLAATGRGPFDTGATPGTLHNVIHADPDLRALPESVRRIAHACLSRDPAARPTPAALLASIGGIPPAVRPWPAAIHDMIALQQAEVARLLHGPARPPYPYGPSTVPVGTGRRPTRRRALWLAGAGAVLGVAAAGGVGTWAATRGGGGSPSGSRSSKGGSGGSGGRKPAVILTGHTGPVESVAFSPDGKTLATASRDGTARLWNVSAHQPAGSPMPMSQGTANKAIFSPDGRTLVTQSIESGIQLWNVADQSRLGGPIVPTDVIAAGLPETKQATSDVAVSPDGSTLAIAGSAVWLYTAASPHKTGTLKLGDLSLLTRVAYSPDGRILAVTDNKVIQLWDTASGSRLGSPLTGHTSYVFSLAFSPDGRTLASGGNDTSVRLWDVASRSAHGQPLVGHSHDIQGLAFSPDGRTLASGSADATVRLWDVAGGTPIGRPLTGQTQDVTDVAYSPDGRLLATSSSDHTAWLWDLS